MVENYINRRLKIGDEYFSEGEVLERGSVLVVLAEPGAGKTELLKEFGRLLDVVPIRASRFRHQTRLAGALPLIIDALDEAAKIDQSAVDQVVVKAQENSNGRVIFASRSSEWQEARTIGIRECFGTEPVIVRIDHFTPDEQKVLFKKRLPAEDFAAFAGEVERFELTPLLGNPQFLILFADAYVQSGRHFTSKAQIFRDAMERLVVEAGNAVAGVPRPTSNEVISVASEVMAKLLLSGASGVSAKEQLADIDYPYLSALAGANVATTFAALDTRLFKPGGEPDQHEPVHRIVAEYCAAQFLVRRICDPQNPFSLRRAFAVIAPNGVVRDELRGLLGWTASIGTERIQKAAIELDPYAVLANGDLSQLTAASKRLLLLKLASAAEANPGFRRGDYWRRFSVGGFFTQDLSDDVGAILRASPAGSPLVDLLLELLVNSGGPPTLLDDIRAIMLNQTADRHTRVWAGRAIAKLAGAASPADMDALVQEATSASLRLAIDLLWDAGVGSLTDDAMEAFLRAFISIYPTHQSLRDDSGDMTSYYYLKEVIEQFAPAQAAEQLDRLTAGLACTCGHPEYDCRCRNGVSKVAGKLLDRYFGVTPGPHDPDRVWGWVRSLWYSNHCDAEKSAAITTMRSDSELRHQLHRRAFRNAADYNEIWDVRWHLDDSHHHSGLAFCAGDERRMADFAFETDNAGLWVAFWSHPQSRTETRGPDSFRRHLREQAALKPAFSAEWAKRERGFRAMRIEQQRRWERRQRRWGKRNEQRSADDRQHLADNRVLVESGNHWPWVRTFAQLYFWERHHLAEYTDDMSLVDNALRNCLPLIANYVPTVQQLAGSASWTVAYAAFVSCWIQFRDGGSLEHVDPAILLSAKVESSKYQTMSDGDYEAFERELDRLLFPRPEQAEEFARTFIEPGLAGPREAYTRVSWLSNKEVLTHLRASLPIEWLKAFPAMPVSAREELFNLAAIAGDRAALLEIIGQGARAAAMVPAYESAEGLQRRMDDLRFWQIRKFFFEGSDTDGWEDLRDNPDIIFPIADKAGRFGDEIESWPSLSAEKIFKILNAFVDVWPPVHLPSSYGSGDPPEETAYRFLSDVVWRIGRDTPERALPVLERLKADVRFAGFKEALLTLRAETVKKFALSGFNAPAPLLDWPVWKIFERLLLRNWAGCKAG